MSGKQASEEAADEEDTVVSINPPAKKKKKNKLGKRSMEDREQAGNVKPTDEGGARKRVRFDLSRNKVTEFFKHGKVAQRVLQA